jgi:hypothetical protein
MASFQAPVDLVKVIKCTTNLRRDLEIVLNVNPFITFKILMIISAVKFKLEALIPSKFYIVSNLNLFFFNSPSRGWSPKWVHSARWSLLAYCNSTWWLCEVGEFGGMKIGRGKRSTRKKPASAILCPPQILLDQTQAWTEAAAMGSQRLRLSYGSA